VEEIEARWFLALLDEVSGLGFASCAGLYGSSLI
jgi:hypothetical protein